MIWNIRKEKNPISTARRKKESKKKQGQRKEPLGQLQHSNIYIIGVPEGEEKEQEIGNVFEKIMKEIYLIC